MRTYHLILLLFFTTFFNSKSFAEYYALKISNDQCKTTSLEGAVRIYATGDSGPYIVYGPNNVSQTIASGQVSTTFNNLGEGIHEFIVKNINGCETLLSKKILKVDCGFCNADADRSYNDYPVAGTNNLLDVSNSNLQTLKDNFTSEFTINSDLLKGKICVKDQCIDRTSVTPGKIYYSHIDELKSRLKSISNSIKVKLFEVGGMEILGTETSDGRFVFSGLTSGQYQLKVLLVGNVPVSSSTRIGGRVTNIILTDRVITLRSINCDNSIKTSLAKIQGSNVNNDNEDQLNELNENIINNIDFSSVQLKAWPNPTPNKINIQVVSNIEFDSQILLMNSVGETVMERECQIISGQNSINVDLTNLANGVYTICLKTKDGILKHSRITKTN